MLLHDMFGPSPCEAIQSVYVLYAGMSACQERNAEKADDFAVNAHILGL